jgi:hypothetical protein
MDAQKACRAQAQFGEKIEKVWGILIAQISCRTGLGIDPIANNINPIAE